MKFVLHATSKSQNKLFYQLLPDGIICAYAAKGIPNGHPGFLQPDFCDISDSLKNGTETELLSNIQVTSVFPMKCPRTHLARKIIYSNNTKSIDFSCLIFVRDDVSDNTIQKGDLWCTNLVHKLLKHFPDMNLTFRGIAANFGLMPPSSLDLFLLAEDVANLAMLAYEDSIRDYSFFSNPDIVRMYFNHPNATVTIFQKMFRI